MLTTLLMVCSAATVKSVPGAMARVDAVTNPSLVVVTVCSLAGMKVSTSTPALFNAVVAIRVVAEPTIDAPMSMIANLHFLFIII